MNFNINWINIFTTIISTFVGAYFAYRYNLRTEFKKYKRQIRADFCSLSSRMYLNLQNMFIYKKYLDNIKKSYNNNIYIKVIMKHPDILFPTDTDKYVFLNDCNRYFLSELENIKTIYKQFEFYFSLYEKEILNITYKEDTKNMSKLFNSIYEIFNMLCIKLYCLNKQLNKCYDRFFNIYYLNLKKDEELLDSDMKKYFPIFLNNEDFIKINSEFDKYWRPEKTFKESLIYHYKKLKHNIKYIKIYFLGVK